MTQTGNSPLLDVKVLAGGKVIRIRFMEEVLDAGLADQLTSELNRLIRFERFYQFAGVFLSFEPVRQVDSSAIKVILRFWRDVSLGSGAVVHLVGCDGQVRRFVTLCKLDHVFGIYRDEAAALADVPMETKQDRVTGGDG